VTVSQSMIEAFIGPFVTGEPALTDPASSPVQ
jgi:hypothetical protein